MALAVEQLLKGSCLHGGTQVLSREDGIAPLLSYLHTDLPKLTITKQPIARNGSRSTRPEPVGTRHGRSRFSAM